MLIVARKELSTEIFFCLYERCTLYAKIRSLTNWMWWSVVCTLIDNDACHHSGQNVVDSQDVAEWVHNKFWPLWWHISLSIRIHTTLNHISISFLPQYQRQRKSFFRARAEKGIAWHIDASSVVWTLIDNGKLANQIARLVAIVVKKIKCVYMTCLYPFQIGGKTEFYYKKKKWG